MLIRSFGEFWNPFVVNWKKRQLMGKGPAEYLHDINFWNAKGIYVLLREFKPIYVGQAYNGEGCIGQRLKDHKIDRFAGRWDMFSWYSINKANKTNNRVAACEIRLMSLKDTVDTLEALSILITDPPLNRKRERMPGAIEFDQIGKLQPRTPTEYFELILTRLPKDSKNPALQNTPPK